MNDLAAGDVVETDFSGTKTVHTIFELDTWPVNDLVVKIRPPMPGGNEGDWFCAKWFKKVGAEVREVESNQAQ